MKRLNFALGGMLISLASNVMAAPVAFTLGDHLDAALFKAGGEPYGVRIDDAPPPGNGPTFSVGTNLGGGGGPVTLTWDPMDLSVDAVISGVTKRDDDGTFWDVNYTLTGLAAAGSGGFTSTSASGSIDEQGGALRSLTLTGEANGGGFVFEFDNDGHRLPSADGWVGRGWLLPTGSTDDWLVIATPVPVPATVWLFGSALGLLVWARRRPA